ncbi:MAG: hypothetical protein RL536_559 [Candidatus Parcubacteria bacterium]|jgi:hypothetical protein
MKNIPTIFLQILTVLIAIAAVVFLLWEPQVEGVNAHATLFEIYFTDPFLVYAYIGSIPFFVVLYNAFKVLGYVRQDKVFSDSTFKALRTIKYCAVIIICFAIVGEIFIMLNTSDDRAGGVFMGVLVVSGSILIVAIAETFEQVLQSGGSVK